MESDDLRERGKIAETPEASEFTSAHEQIEAVKQREHDLDSVSSPQGCLAPLYCPSRKQ